MNPDFSISAETGFASHNVSGVGGLHLVKGSGAVELTVDQGCMPLSPSGFNLQITVNMTTVPISESSYRLEIFTGKIEVRNLSGTLQATINRSVAIGDRLKVEIVNGFRFYINDVLQHERTTGFTSVSLPARYIVFVTRALSPVVARVPPIRLIGDWRLLPNGQAPLQWTTEHGSLATVSGQPSQRQLSNAVNPGTYKIAARFSGGAQHYFQDQNIPGSTVTSSGGSWLFLGPGTVPVRQIGSGSLALFGPVAAGHHFYQMANAPTTLAISPGDHIRLWLSTFAANPTQEMMVQFQVTDSTDWEHRAYWGADLIALGTNGTPSRRRIGDLPASGGWVFFEFPASLLDLEGRVLRGLRFDLFDGEGAFDGVARIPFFLQYAEAFVTIPSLEILGESPRTIQPGTRVRFQTNYDVAQNDIVTWSVVSGGGSFTAGEFFVPSAPGTTVVRATSGSKVADLTLNIPAVITPGFAFAAPLEQINWNTNIEEPVDWDASAGTINGGTGEWIAPDNLGLTVKITATDGVFTATRDVLILKKFPITSVSAPIQWKRSKTVLVSEAEDGTRVSRIKNKGGSPREAYEVRITLLTLTDLETIQAFWDEHYPGKQFVFEDAPRNIRKIVYFDSDINAEGSARAFDVSFRIKEA
jgi:hypothetical protein